MIRQLGLDTMPLLNLFPGQGSHVVDQRGHLLVVPAYQGIGRQPIETIVCLLSIEIRSLGTQTVHQHRKTLTFVMHNRRRKELIEHLKGHLIIHELWLC